MLGRDFFLRLAMGCATATLVGAIVARAQGVPVEERDTEENPALIAAPPAASNPNPDGNPAEQPAESMPTSTEHDSDGRYIQSVGTPFYTPDGAFTSANPLVIPGQPFGQDSSFVLSGSYSSPKADNIYANMLAATAYTNAPGSDVNSVLGTIVATESGSGGAGGAFQGVAYAPGSVVSGAELAADSQAPSTNSVAVMLEAGGSYPNVAFARLITVGDGAGAAQWGLQLDGTRPNPFQDDGTIIGAVGSNVKVAYGIDLTNVEVDKAAFASRNFAVDGAGNITAMTGWFQNGYSSSDLRLKKDIAPLQDSLEKVLRLNGVGYSWKDRERGTDRQMGFVAQDVEKVFPELVKTDKKGFLAINYQGLEAPLAESIKTLAVELKSVKAENRELKARVDRLEKEMSGNRL